METFLQKIQHLRIQLEEIKSAIGNFDNNNVIGKGGFGKVYKGVLSHSKGQSMVAIKRLDREHGQGDPEFWKEVFMLSQYTHENLISLLGFCDEDGEKILVYEHASHGSLDNRLCSPTLTWRQRLEICLGAATGLCHLHDPKGTHQRVIHRDKKSSNILMDKDWNAKVSDMGLSKVRPTDQPDTFLVTGVVGTPGYIDPLYMEINCLTKESDVYSFGVVLFEVLCGRLCFIREDGRFRSLVPTWKKSYEEKKLDQNIFEDLKQQMDLRSLETFSGIAYRCLHKLGEQRPMMSSVVEELEIAIQFQKMNELVDYEELNSTAVCPQVYGSEQELKMLLSNGILVDGGKTVEEHEEVLEDEDLELQRDTYWEQKLPSDCEDLIKWSKDGLQWTTKRELYSILRKGFLIRNGRQDGKKCHMLPASMALWIHEWRWGSSPHSRFEKVALFSQSNFHLMGTLGTLSPHTRYACYLVYRVILHNSNRGQVVKVMDEGRGNQSKRGPWFVLLLLPKISVIRPQVDHNTHNPLTRTNMKGLPQHMDDGWFEVQINAYKTGANTFEHIVFDLCLWLQSFENIKEFVVQGIEFKHI